MSFLVLKLAYEIGKEAMDVLMEKNISQIRLDEFAALIMTIPEVKRIDRLRAREHGHYILVDLRVGVPGEMTIQEGHDVSHKIRDTIMACNEDVDEVLIHLNPWYEDNE